MSSILYISYDGLMEPLGQSQVWQYLSGLSANHQIVLLSYEKAADWANESERARIKATVSAKGVTWVPLRYHSKPSAIATAFDIALGIVIGGYLLMRHQIKIVHARSYVSSVIALSLKKLLGIKYIFDMRGFWADERVDGGLWQRGSRLYRVAKWFEKHFLLNADCVVSLTQAGIDEMKTFSYLQQHMPHFELLTTCADLNLFKPAECKPTARLNNRHFTLGYVGSVGVWYQFDKVLKCFKILQEIMPESHLHILNRGSHEYIREKLKEHAISAKNVRLEAADHQGVASAMKQMDSGIFFYRQAYSKTASAPTKLGEFLGCGVPCLGNAGVGDMAAIIESERVGVAVTDFSDETMRKGISDLLKLVSEPDIQKRCREAALHHFSLEDGVSSYNRIYHELSTGDLR